MNRFLRYLADNNSAHRQTDRHTPMTTRPCGLRRAGKHNVHEMSATCVSTYTQHCTVKLKRANTQGDHRRKRRREGDAAYIYSPLGSGYKICDATATLRPCDFLASYRRRTKAARSQSRPSCNHCIRDLRSFEIRFDFESDVPIRIRFESDVPIRKFRFSRTCRVPSYHKLRSLTVQQKHQPLRCL